MAQHSQKHNRGTGVKDRSFEPELYDVILLNDDFTTMEFVVDMLRTIFFMPIAKAEKVMLDVHKKGKGVAGTYDLDTAQSKQHKAERMARNEGFPLRLLIQTHNQ